MLKKLILPMKLSPRLFNNDIINEKETYCNLLEFKQNESESTPLTVTPDITPTSPTVNTDVPTKHDASKTQPTRSGISIS
jgi:hypothetical protein